MKTSVTQNLCVNVNSHKRWKQFKCFSNGDIYIIFISKKEEAHTTTPWTNLGSIALNKRSQTLMYYDSMYVSA